jgi:transcriptional regulator with XRE-family HTH domain
MIKNLPEKLKSLRTKYGFSQKQVADKLGVSPSIVSGYETGERTPSTEILLSLSYLFGCSTDYLLGKSSEKPTMKIDVSKLNDNQIQAINALIESFLN